MNRLIKVITLAVLASLSLASHAGVIDHGIFLADGDGVTVFADDDQYRFEDMAYDGSSSNGYDAELTGEWEWTITSLDYTGSLTVTGAVIVNRDDDDELSSFGSNSVGNGYVTDEFNAFESIFADGTIDDYYFADPYVEEAFEAVLMLSIVIEVVAGEAFGIAFTAVDSEIGYGSPFAESDGSFITLVGSTFTPIDDADPTDVPEPGTLGLLALGLGALALRRRVAA